MLETEARDISLWHEFLKPLLRTLLLGGSITFGVIALTVIGLRVVLQSLDGTVLQWIRELPPVVLAIPMAIWLTAVLFGTIWWMERRELRGRTCERKPPRVAYPACPACGTQMVGSSGWDCLVDPAISADLESTRADCNTCGASATLEEDDEWRLHPQCVCVQEDVARAIADSYLRSRGIVAGKFRSIEWEENERRWVVSFDRAEPSAGGNGLVVHVSEAGFASVIVARRDSSS